MCGIEAELLRKLRKWTGAGADADAPEGACVLREGVMDEIVRHMEQVLLTSPELVFQRDQLLVRVTCLPERVEEDGVILPKGTLTVLPASPPWTTRAVARHGKFVKFSPAASKYVPADPPTKYINMLLASAGEWPFPVLHGIINTPILLPDGEVVHETGYHAGTGLYLDTKGVTFPPVGTDVGAALELLRKPFTEYSWDSATNGLSIVLSAILCVLCRNLVPFVPAHAFDALYPGSGKSYLFSAIAEIALGNPAPSVVMTSSAEENQKRLETALLRATQMLMLDNVSQEVGGDLLCQAVTKDVIEIRVLGRSESLNVKNTTTVLINGNGLVFFGDFTRRVLVAKIDPGRPDPENAEFPFAPMDVAKQYRPELVMAALTIVREYLLAGCPDLPKPIGSFEKYSLIRGALMWAGMPDPCENMQQTKDQDPAAQFMREALSLWSWPEPVTLADIANDGAWDDGNRPHRVRELLRLAAGLPMFDARKIGVFLKSWVGRQINMGDHWLVLQAHARDSGIKKYWVARTNRQGDLY